MSFVRALKLEAASEIQISEMQKAFYAGAAASWNIINAISRSVPSTDEGIDAATTSINEIAIEIQQFATDVDTQLSESDRNDRA